MFHREIRAIMAGRQRRQEPRIVQTMRMIAMRVDGEEHSVGLLNLSTHGASVRADQPLPPGRMVALIFDDGREVKGRVRWVRDNRIGIQFHLRLPVTMLGPMRVRERRVLVRRHVMLDMGGQMRPALVRNVSTKGMLIEATAGFVPGQWITVRCGAGWAVDAQVRWARANAAGLQTAIPISLDDFEEASARALPGQWSADPPED